MLRFARVSVLLFLAVSLRAAESPTASAASTNRPGASHVLIISVDGLRPDCILRTPTPNLRGLMQRGAFTFYAMTTDVAITLPSHTSMVTGYPPEIHGVFWNSDHPEYGHPDAPTVFELARRAGHTTAMAAGKSKFSTLAKTNTLDLNFVPLARDSTAADMDVARAAARMIEARQPNLLFVHLPNVDGAGHEHGWGSPEQLAAVTKADAAVGVVFEALESAGLLRKTIIILSADHGGTAKTHGGMDPRSRLIPWIIAGPGVRPNLDLSQFRTLEVHTEDTFATACYLLNIPIDADVKGKFVKAAFDKAAPAN